MKGGRPVDRSPRSIAAASRPPESPPSEGPGQGPTQGWRRGVDHRCAVQDRAPLRVCELAQAQGSHRLLGGDRATQAGYRHQRHRSSQEHDDAHPDAAQCSTWLRQRWTAHVGCRVPRPMGITESGETGYGAVDARARVGCAPGRRRTADASRAQWRSHPDDGGARVPRCGWHGARLRHRVVRAFPPPTAAAAESSSEATNTGRPAHAGPSHDHRANGSPAGTSSADRGCAARASVAQRK
jgi:hypothetical protein